MYIGKCKYDVYVTIGRTFGSGGREIGKKVARELEIPFYDKELLEVEAAEGRLSFEELEKFDEKRASGFIYSLAFNPHTGPSIMSWDMMIQEVQRRAIETVAGQGSCVIVGRRADKILRLKHDILSVFISASMKDRIARVSKRDVLSKKDSEEKILKADKARQSYYNAQGEGNWGDAANYNLCIDSGDLGIDHSVDMILQYLKRKGRLL